MSVILIIMKLDSEPRTPIFESNNYSGPIPREKEWIRMGIHDPAMRVISITYIYSDRSFRLETVIVEVQ